MSETHEGYFLIADITGYTRYLSESELEHAQDTLTALLELLVENTRPPLVISRLAGDAVISYGLRESFFQGQTIIEKIEDTYVAFRKTIERLVLNNSCQCNACANISNLDLKFFIHFGTFGLQRISDHDELVGSDINLLHRLLKNSVTEKTGVRAYALFTEAAIQQLGGKDLADGMTPHNETYEYLGEVKVWVQDMHPVWEQKRSAVTFTLPVDRIWKRIEVDISMPRERVWDYLIQPEFRNTLIGTDRMEITNRSEGRIAPGSVYQCYHGDKLVPQTILEWQPFESMIVKELTPMSHAVSSLVEYRLDSIEGGTRLTRTLNRPTGPVLGRTLLRLMSPILVRITKDFHTSFAQRIEDDYRAHGGMLTSEAEVTGEQIREAAGAGLQASTGSQ
jgi:uncharacterized protein YndB with AHSA1/START domain